MKKTIKGACHIHSSYSFDGEASLEQLRKRAKKEKLQFLLMTEHSISLNSAKYEAYRKHCEKLSDDSFIIIPGLEVLTKNRTEIICIDVDIYLHAKAEREILQEMKKKKKLTIFPHPSRCDPADRETSNQVSFLEVWSARYDGRLSPSKTNIEFYKQEKKKNHNLKCMNGLDLHYLEEFGRNWIELEVSHVAKKDILAALRKGDYLLKNRLCTLTPNGIYQGKIALTLLNSIDRSKRTLGKKLGKFIPKKIRTLLRKWY
ncbi:PHP domain-containing protein [Candidatus Woesearchaeota archaeon]|nr:MAG: PHP domain-containing protein [Candidatus Woesearchaeota archaeon]